MCTYLSIWKPIHIAGYELPRGILQPEEHEGHAVRSSLAAALCSDCHSVCCHCWNVVSGCSLEKGAMVVDMKSTCTERSLFHTVQGRVYNLNLHKRSPCQGA